MDALDRPRLVVIIGGGGDDEYPKSGGREVFVGGGGRRNGRFVSWSAVVVKGTISGKRWHGLNPYYERPGWGGVGRTLAVVEAKSEVWENCADKERIKRIR